MLAFLGDELTLKESVEEICAEAKGHGVCEAVNFNTPGQIIISGEVPAIEKAKSLAKTKKIRALPLNVSGAFHSSLMNEAAEKMAEEVRKYVFGRPRFPVVTNCDAAVTSDVASLLWKLPKQINSPVLWNDSVRKIIAEGVGAFVELGPKNALSGMVKKIEPSAKTHNVENEETLNHTLEGLKNV